MYGTHSIGVKIQIVFAEPSPYQGMLQWLLHDDPVAASWMATREKSGVSCFEEAGEEIVVDLHCRLGQRQKWHLANCCGDRPLQHRKI